MRVQVLVAALAIATRAGALAIVPPPLPPPLPPPPPPPPPGCLTNAECDPGPDLPCGVGRCVNGACVLDFASSKVVCRPANGPCDVAERCTGDSAACPADKFASSSVVCRPKAGDCDVPEQCTGTSAACPADQFVSAGTICRSAANDCDVAEACNGSSKDCPADANFPPGTSCENASACVSGGACAGPVCIGGKPELTFSPDTAEFTQGAQDVDIVIKHTGSGDSITLTAAGVDPAGTFRIVAAPQWPVDLASGAQVRLTVRLAGDATPGDHTATLKVLANNCADQPMQLHANIASTAPVDGTPDAGPGSGSGGPSSASSGANAKGGGCSSGGTPAGTFALLALGSVALRRRRGQARAAA